MSRECVNQKILELERSKKERNQKHLAKMRDVKEFLSEYRPEIRKIRKLGASETEAFEMVNRCTNSGLTVQDLIDYRSDRDTRITIFVLVLAFLCIGAGVIIDDRYSYALEVLGGGTIFGLLLFQFSLVK